MADPYIAAGMVGAGALSSIIGGNQARKAAEKYAAMEMQARNEALRYYESIGIPSIEAQQLILQNPEVVYQFAPELEQYHALQKSAYEDINIDPRLKEAQMQALSGLEERAAAGLTPEDEALINELRRKTTGEMRAQDATILQNLERRGFGGSGMELASRQGAAQAATQRAAEEADRLASLNYQAKMAALMGAGELGGKIGQQEFAQEAQKASAEDLINRFNAEQRGQVQQRNIERANQAAQYAAQLKQEQANQRAALSNQQQQYNKQLIQQQYQNQMQKANAQANIKTGQAAGYGQQGQTAAKNIYDMYSGLGSSVIGGLKYFGDEDKKKKEE